MRVAVNVAGFSLFIGTCLVTHALSCVHSAFASCERHHSLSSDTLVDVIAMPRSKPPSYRDYSNLATLQSIRSGGRCCRLHPMITVIVCTHLSYKSGQGAWVRCRSDRIVIIYRFFRPSPSHRHRIPIDRAYICYSVRGNTYIGSSSSTPGYSTLPHHFVVD